MSSYTPDNWVIVKVLTPSNETIYKVLASWSGSYAYGGSWKLSSAIVAVLEEDEQYVLPQESGSTYFCRKSRNSTSLTIASVLQDLKDVIASDPNNIKSIEIVDISEVES